MHDQLGVLRRRKWLLLLVTIAVPVAAIAFSLHQKTLYQASSNVILNRQDLAAQVTDTSNVSTEDPVRFIDTQATIARSTELVQEVIGALQLHETPAQFLKHSSVDTSQSADVITFSDKASTSDEAMRVATAYAHQYTDFRHRLDTEALNSATRDVAAQIGLLRRQGRDETAFFQTLLEKEQQLRTLAALTTSHAKVIHAAGSASKVQPRPARNGALALVLGLLLGIAFVFLREALDNRVRSADEMARYLGVPLLARLPQPPRRLRRTNSLVSLADPASPHAEAFRMLRTNLEFATIDSEVQAIMVTSAEEQEGKSTTAANLAVMLARGGRRVVLVDLDLRRPYLHKFFDVDIHPGVTDVALGRITADSAVHRIAVVPTQSDAVRRRPPRSNGHSEVHGFLELMTAGSVPPDPGDFAGSAALAAVISELRERADFVIVDSPPLLPVGDAMTLSPNLDGIVLLTRMNKVRRRAVNELRRAITVSPARTLGFVVTDAGHEDGYAYYYGRGHYSAQYSDRTQEPVS